MPQVFAPPAMRELLGGQTDLQAPGETVRDVLDWLESEYPGAKARLLDDDQLKPGIAVVVNGRASSLGLRQPLEPTDEVHFLPALGGG